MDDSYQHLLRDRRTRSSARTVIQILRSELGIRPASVIDVGCGVGTWLDEFRKQGATEVLGLDRNHYAEENLVIEREDYMSWDLEKDPLELDRRWDLAMSLEVAEHLSPEKAEHFVRFLCDLAREERGKMYKAVNEGLGAIKETRILGRGSQLVDMLVRSLWPYMGARRYRRLARFSARPYLEFLAVSGLLGIGMVLLAQGYQPTAIAPALSLFAAALIRLRASGTRIVGPASSVYYRLASVEPVYDDMRLLEEQEQRAAARATGEGRLPLTDCISARGVTYSYPNAGEQALRDVDLEVRKGSSVALVGPTGAGKTTLVDVLLGLLEPEEGTVEVDGVDIRTNLRGWQDNIGYIPQEIYLTDDTVRRNVALGLEDDDIEEDRLWQALRAAQIADFVEDMPDGADTVVGERGVRVSGGQKQRIGIARALYHNPDVLVMDEPTSSLDMETERRVVEAINELKGDRTVVIIAHRIATVKRCDRLFFLKKGRLDASGTYDELLENHNQFRAMAT